MSVEDDAEEGEQALRLILADAARSIRTLRRGLRAADTEAAAILAAHPPPALRTWDALLASLLSPLAAASRPEQQKPALLRGGPFKSAWLGTPRWLRGHTPPNSCDWLRKLFLDW